MDIDVMFLMKFFVVYFIFYIPAIVTKARAIFEPIFSLFPSFRSIIFQPIGAQRETMVIPKSGNQQTNSPRKSLKIFHIKRFKKNSVKNIMTFIYRIHFMNFPIVSNNTPQNFPSNLNWEVNNHKRRPR